MNAPAKIGRSLVDDCCAKREALLQAFCALEIELAAILGPNSPKVFSQKIDCLTTEQLSGIDPKSLIASRNLVAHAHIVAASRSGTRDELNQWYAALTKEIERLRSSISSIR